jgi:hypothetical protein
MPRRQLVSYALVFVALLVYCVWALGLHWRKWRLRRKLVKEGRVTTTRSPRDVKASLGALALGAAAFPVFWACERYVKPVAGSVWSMIAFSASMFVGIFAFIALRAKGTSDFVALGALHRAKQGDVDGAVQSLRAAMSEAPSAARAGAMGKVLADAGRWEEAADANREALRLYPEEPLFTVNLALALTKIGRAAEALPILEAARRATPEEAGCAAAEAIALAALGRADEAAEQHRQAKELVEAVPGVQRLDMWTLGTVLVECANAVQEASTRGFAVVVPGASANGPEVEAPAGPRLARDNAPGTGPTA